MMRNQSNSQSIISERFGDPIGTYSGDAPVGVRDEREDCDCSEEGCIHCVHANEVNMKRKRTVRSS